jgi:hypothetical protein
MVKLKTGNLSEKTGKIDGEFKIYYKRSFYSPVVFSY